MSNAKENAYPDVTSYGLNKRELFAAMAMQGSLAHIGGSESADQAKWAVECADALLAALEAA